MSLCLEHVFSSAAEEKIDLGKVLLVVILGCKKRETERDRGERERKRDRERET